MGGYWEDWRLLGVLVGYWEDWDGDWVHWGGYWEDWNGVWVHCGVTGNTEASLGH